MTCKDCGSEAELKRGGRCIICKRKNDLARVTAWNAKNPERLREYQRKSYAKNAEKRRKYQREWKANHPEESRAQQKRQDERRSAKRKTDSEFRRRVFMARIKTYFGLSESDFDSMLVSQCGRCEICTRPLSDKKNGLNIDHDHSTGAVRGLLCGPCNMGLGMFFDSAESLESAARYLCSRRQVLQFKRCA